MLDYTQISGVHTENKYLRQRYDTGVVNRPAGYQLGTSLNADSDMETTYAYVANDGRLSQVTTESFETHVDTFTYSYGSAGQYGPTLLSGPQIYSAKSYLSGAPYFDIIDNKTSSGGSTVAKADYRYDTLGRRDRKDFSGNAYGSATYDTYGYNVNFEVTQGKRFTSGGAAVSGKEYNFTYDDIGNRLTSRDKYTTSAYDTAYTPNARNQYSGITGYHAASPVTYDTDGNLSALGTKTFLYNGENQLIEVKVGGSSVASFKYDFLGRRVEKSTPSKTETYAYDGWNLIALYDTGTGDKRPLITYSWGLDLSDTMQGAGGVGGLLMSCERDGTAWTYFEDGHGNVTQVVSQSSGSVNAHMEYDPYGNLATTEPTWDRRNAFRFSSKFYDDETGLYYYGYRYYDGVYGRWLNRDPIGERGGENLHAFVYNDAINQWDYLGMWNWRDPWGGGQGFIPGRYTASRLQNGAIGAASGAVSGAAVGAGVGAGVGAIGAGVGAAPGAAAGASAGGIGGAISGFVSGVIADPNASVGSVATSGAISGTISGLTGGAGGGLGAAAGRGGTRALTHYTSSQKAAIINSTQQLGRSESSSLWATTGSAAGTTVAGKTAVSINGPAANAFRPVLAAGPLSAYGRLAGFHSAGGGILSLSNGTYIAGGGINSQLARWYLGDAAFNAFIGGIASTYYIEPWLFDCNPGYDYPGDPCYGR